MGARICLIKGIFSRLLKKQSVAPDPNLKLKRPTSFFLQFLCESAFLGRALAASPIQIKIPCQLACSHQHWMYVYLVEIHNDERIWYGHTLQIWSFVSKSINFYLCIYIYRNIFFSIKKLMLQPETLWHLWEILAWLTISCFVMNDSSDPWWWKPLSVNFSHGCLSMYTR